jgi:hypothetical protein
LLLLSLIEKTLKSLAAPENNPVTAVTAYIRYICPHPSLDIVLLQKNLKTLPRTNLKI